MNNNSKIAISVLSGITIISIALSIFFYSNVQSTNTMSKYTNDQAFAEVTTSLSKIDSAMNKLNYATTPSYTITMLTEVFAETKTAKANLDILPINEEEVGKTAEFVSKLGDYSLSLIKKVANGDTLTDEDLSNIRMFTDNATSLADEIAELQYLYNNGDLLDFSLNITTFNSEKIENVGNFDDAEQSTDVEMEMQDFATLVYDGPFSAHINQLEPLYLADKSQLSEDEALQKAKEIFGTDDVTFTGKVDGQIPCYKFNVVTNDRELSMDMTVNGGYVLNLLDYRIASEGTISSVECVENAEKILESSGFKDFEATYYTESNGICTINFAFKQENVIMYPDLIKVSIYKDTGKLKGLEARGFMMSNTVRTDISAEISVEKARENISPNLTILSEQLAIIPTSSKGEVLTYEFKCENEFNEHYIVYINAKNAQIENILILIEDENGTLTF